MEGMEGWSSDGKPIDYIGKLVGEVSNVDNFII